jgi:hypothetical protein
MTTARTTRDAVELMMVERLVQLDRVDPDFDPLTWMEDIKHVTKGFDSRLASSHNLELGISLYSDYKDALQAVKTTHAYKQHMKDKPCSKHKPIPKAWHNKREELLVEFIRSTPYSSQATQKITTPVQAEQAERNRLLTYLFHSLAATATKRKSVKTVDKRKESKAPEAVEPSGNPTYDDD